jgi:4-amino-4-deoxy-L-arabinose transferase-like glycosyltransferase
VSFRKKLLLLILFSTLLRFLIAGGLEFGNDEVYYWTYAQHLQWNYFDHPPGVAWLIRAGTLNLLWQSEFFVRLGAVMCAAANTWLMFQIGRKIRDERTGWYAALLFTSSFYCSVIAGTFILPDSPQLLFWILSVYLTVVVLHKDSPERIKNRALIGLGITIGLCIMCKVHGIFLWLGLGAYVLFFQPSLLKNGYLYLSAALTAAIISPIFFWNWQNHFVTYAYHGGRVGFFGKHLDGDGFLQQLLGSIFYNNPVNMVIYGVALLGIARKKRLATTPTPYLPLFLLLSFPLIGLLLLMSLFNDTLPHWSGPAYIGLMAISAEFFSARFPIDRKTPKSFATANILFVSVVLAGVLVIRFLPFPIGDRSPQRLGRGDVTLDMSGWEKFSAQFDSLYLSDKSSGRMKPDAFILSDFWYPAANLDYYVAHPNGIALLALGRLNDIHHYAWLNKWRPELKPGADAYFIYPSNYYGPPKDALKNYFNRVEDSVVIPQFRGREAIVRNFVIYRMHDYKGGIGADGLLN